MGKASKPFAIENLIKIDISKMPAVLRDTLVHDSDNIDPLTNFVFFFSLTCFVLCLIKL